MTLDWSWRDPLIERMRDKGARLWEIADAAKCGESTVGLRLRDLDMPRGGRRVSWPKDVVIADWLGLGWSPGKIAKQIGCGATAVRARIRQRRIKPTSFPGVRAWSFP